MTDLIFPDIVVRPDKDVKVYTELGAVPSDGLSGYFESDMSTILRDNDYPSLSYRFPLVGYIGASITSGTGSSNAGTTSYRVVTSKLAGSSGYVSISSVLGATAGANAELIVSSHLSTLIATGIDVLVIGPDFGTNDSALSMSDYLNALFTIVRSCKKAGIHCYFCLTMPPGSTVPHIMARNIAAMARFRLNPDVTIIDTYSPMLDPATGFLLAAYDSDGTHPNDAGHAALASVISTKLIATLKKQPWPVQHDGEGTLSNPTIQGAVTPTNWSYGATSFSGTTTTTIVDRDDDTDLPIGRWASVALDGTGVAAGYRQFKCTHTLTVAEGDVIAIFAYLKKSGNGAVYLKNINQSGTSIAIFHTVAAGASQAIQVNYTIPSGMTAMNIVLETNCPANETTTGFIGAVDMFKVSSISV